MQKNNKMKRDISNIITGRVSKNLRGFAFIIPDSNVGAGGDIFVAEEDLSSAMNNDIVKVKVSDDPYGRNRNGVVIEILERANIRIIGNYFKRKSGGCVIPDDTKVNETIVIPADYPCDAEDGQKVVVEVVKWPDSKNPVIKGVVTDVLGTPGEVVTEELAIMAAYGIDRDFPDKVLEEASHIPNRVVITEKILKSRQDLRGLRMITMDGDDARDLDDAVSVELLDNKKVRLGVHIADVSYYVTKGGIIDVEAYKRATSVYFPDRVCPMLPPVISNEICSLNAGADRLAFSVFMDINHSGEVENYKIFESIINVRKRTTYKKVNIILEGHEDEREEIIAEYGEQIANDLFIMKELSDVLRQKRIARGAIEFDFPECTIKMEKPGVVADVVKNDRSLSERIIEEFMICCNETVAEHYFNLGAPFVYRIHEEPDRMKIDGLGNLARRYGFSFKHLSSVKPHQIQALMQQIEGTSMEKVINMLILRSLSRAIYSPDAKGHFGLASAHYCHFTSPIRRYPDLMIHRIMKEWLHDKPDNDKPDNSKTDNSKLDGNKPDYSKTDISKLDDSKPDYSKFEKSKKKLKKAADHCSEKEQAADDAERDVDNLLKAAFMSDKVGQVFEGGIVSGVIESGFFVELPNTIEGMVRVESLTDYFEYDEKTLSLYSMYKKRTIKIGDRLKVKLVKADVLNRRLDFVEVRDDEITKIKRTNKSKTKAKDRVKGKKKDSIKKRKK